MNIFRIRFSSLLFGIGTVLSFAAMAGAMPAAIGLATITVAMAFRVDEQLTDIRQANQLLTGGFLKMMESITIVRPEDMKGE